MNAPSEYVPGDPLSVSVDLADASGGRTTTDCPALRLTHPDWDLWWSVEAVQGPTAAPARLKGAPPAGAVGGSGGFSGPPVGAGQDKLVAVVSPEVLRSDWYAVTLRAQRRTGMAQAGASNAVHERTVAVRVRHMPLCDAVTVSVEAGQSISGASFPVLCPQRCLQPDAPVAPDH